MAPTGSRAGEGEEKSAPQKDGYAPGAAFAPDGDVTSGAEEAEWCSEGQTKGGAGGAQWPAVGQSGRDVRDILKSLEVEPHSTSNANNEGTVK